MFANRFTAFMDACTLASVLKRNLLLTLAEAEFFRIRWSDKVMDETEAAIAKMQAAKGHADSEERASKARLAMETAFQEARVFDFDQFLPCLESLPDSNDAHVVAAALKTQASMIVTENLRHFPSNILSPLNIEAKSADVFIADTIALDLGRAVAAVGRMRSRFKNPVKTAQILLLDMEAAGLTETVDILRPHAESL